MGVFQPIHKFEFSQAWDFDFEICHKTKKNLAHILERSIPTSALNLYHQILGPIGFTKMEKKIQVGLSKDLSVTIICRCPPDQSASFFVGGLAILWNERISRCCAAKKNSKEGVCLHQSLQKKHSCQHLGWPIDKFSGYTSLRRIGGHALLQMDAETNFSGLLQWMEGCHPWKHSAKRTKNIGG